jgi:hypothetical protein
VGAGVAAVGGTGVDVGRWQVDLGEHRVDDAVEHLLEREDGVDRSPDLRERRDLRAGQRVRQHRR